MSLNALNVLQSAIMFVGVASGLVVCTGGVAAGRLTVGDTVLFLTLMWVAALRAACAWHPCTACWGRAAVLDCCGDGRGRFSHRLTPSALSSG